MKELSDFPSALSEFPDSRPNFHVPPYVTLSATVNLVLVRTVKNNYFSLCTN